MNEAEVERDSYNELRCNLVVGFEADANMVIKYIWMYRMNS